MSLLQVDDDGPSSCARRLSVTEWDSTWQSAIDSHTKTLKNEHEAPLRKDMSTAEF